MNPTTYPPSSEINEILAPALDVIRARTTYAEYADPATPPIRYREVVREKRPANASQSAPPTPAQLLSDIFRFLRHVADAPHAKLTDHYDAVGGRSKGERLKAELLEKDYITVAPSRDTGRNGGRRPDIVKLTQTGEAFLKSYGQRIA